MSEIEALILGAFIFSPFVVMALGFWLADRDNDRPWYP